VAVGDQGIRAQVQAVQRHLVPVPAVVVQQDERAALILGGA
jgi:hypothetical protein